MKRNKVNTGLAADELTPAILSAMQPGEERGDLACPGLRARATAVNKNARGKPLVTLFYRYTSPVDGKTRQVKLGTFGALTLAEARKRVEALRVQRDSGIDPRLARRQARAEARAAHHRARNLQTVTDVAAYYLASYVEKNRTDKSAAEARRLLEKDVLPVIGKRPVAELQRAEIVALVRSIADRAPRLAAQARTELRAAFHRAADDGRIEAQYATLADGILRADKRLGANKRERALNPSEVAALVKWMPQNYTRTVSDALALTLLTGGRSGEVVAWEWKHYDSEAGTMFQPETKSGTAFTVALSRQAMAILEARREIAKGSEFVFPGRAGHVQQKVVGVEVYAHSGESKASVYKGKAACPVKNWTPHDLRRTARTLLQALGCPFDVGEKVLNHALPSMGETYARDPMIEPRRHWLQKLADHIDALTVDNVVPMKPTKRKA